MPEPKTKAPLKPLPDNYVPTGSKPYKVQNGDSWVTIAKANGNLDPLWLIQYNFETRNPDEVNWYLKHHSGCKRTTSNGRNFVFSGGEVIHLPLTKPPLSNDDVTFFGYGIQLGGDDDFKSSVKPVIGQIMASETGRILLRAIHRTGRTVTIMPYDGTDCNANAAAEDWADATPSGDLIMDKQNKPLLEPSLGNVIRGLLDLPQTPVEGTGRGSDVIVHFTPSIFEMGNQGPCGAYYGKPGSTPSQVLFHELAHAYRQASGKLNRRGMIGTNVAYDNKEEFFAIVLSNVYISDPSNSTARRTPRADHWGFTALSPSLSTSKSFLSTTSNRNHVRELFKEEPILMNELLRVSSSFNPFAEVY